MKLRDYIVGLWYVAMLSLPIRRKRWTPAELDGLRARFLDTARRVGVPDDVAIAEADRARAAWGAGS